MTETTILRSGYRFNESPDSVTSAAIDDDQGRTMIDASVSSVAADSQTEVRADATLTFSDDSGANAAVPTLSTVADSLVPGVTSRLEKLAIGTDATQPSSSDSGLGNPVLTKVAKLSAEGSVAIARSVAFETEPGTQPHDIVEAAVLDDNDDPVTRTTFSAETKDSETRLRLSGGVDITE